MGKTLQFSKVFAGRGAPSRRNLGAASVKAALALPAMLTLAVAMQKKEPASQLDFPPTDQEFNARIDAYVSPMSHAEQIAGDRQKLSPEMIRSYAKVWLEAYDAGKLKPLPTTDLSDSVFDGASGQIIRAQATLEGRLEILVQANLKAGNYELAAQDALTILRLSRIMRHTDLTFDSMLDCWSDQALDMLAEVRPHLNEKARQEIAAYFPRFRTNGAEYAELARSSYGLYLQNELATGERFKDRCPNMTPIEEMGTDGEAPIVIEKVRKSMRSGGNIGATYPFETTLSRSLLHEAQTQAKLEQAIKAYAG